MLWLSIRIALAEVTAKLICVFVFAYAKFWFSHNVVLLTTATYRPRGYKTIFMLNSAEIKIYSAHKC